MRHTLLPDRRAVLRRLGAALALLGLPRSARAEALRIVSRAEWGAAPALPGLVAHAPKDIVLHHTATKRSTRRPFAVKLRNLQAFAQREDRLADGRRKPSWPDLPYHYYIDWQGEVAEGRNVRFKGDTNTGYETAGHIQVVLEGHFDEERPTAAQMASLKALLRHLAQAWSIPLHTLSAHDELAATACPGRHLKAGLPALRAL